MLWRTLLLLVLTLGVTGEVSAQCFRRGDVNLDGRVDIDDDVWLNAFLFLGLATLPCMDAADVNDDGMVSINDSVFLLGYLTLLGPPPPAPGPCDCGPDPTADALTCGMGNCPFVRGDADANGVVDPTVDGNYLNAWLFAAGPAPPCQDAADANDDGIIDVADVILIQSGGPFPYPNPECGLDLTPDNLDCGCYSCLMPVGPKFIRGDVDGDGALTPADINMLNNILFLGAPSLCDDANDVNDDGALGTADVARLTSAVFSWAPLPPPLAWECGIDPTPDALGCATPNQCNCLPIDFMRGDCNADGVVDIADIINILCVVFQPPGTCNPPCRDACDVNDDGCLDISDPIRALNFLFGGGAGFPAPFQTCGYDPTPRENLGCSQYEGCPAL